MTALPAGWRFVRLTDVADTALGKMLDRGKDRGAPRVPYLRNVNVQWGHIDTTDILEMELHKDEFERYAVQVGDVLVCEGGEIGRAAIWHGSAEYMAYQKALHRVRPSRDLDSRYLCHLLEYLGLTGALQAYATGSTILHLPQQRLRELAFPLPGIREQRRIVDALDEHLSHLSTAEGTLKSSIRRLASFRAATLSATITPDDRPTIPLGELVSRIEAGKSFGGPGGPALPDEWGVIKVSAMTWGSFRSEENKAVPANAANPRYEIRNGDLLLSRANTSAYVGASVLVQSARPRLLLSDKSLRLVPKAGVDPQWLQLALSSPTTRRQISALATGTKESMRNISQKALLTVRIPAADGRQQEVDIGAVSRLTDAQDLLSKSIAAVSQRRESLRKSLLAAAFSGRLTRGEHGGATLHWSDT
jgi:type I restriction enzyme, S subunit